jgi:hypothetical protein
MSSRTIGRVLSLKTHKQWMGKHLRSRDNRTKATKAQAVEAVEAVSGPFQNINSDDVFPSTLVRDIYQKTEKGCGLCCWLEERVTISSEADQLGIGACWSRVLCLSNSKPFCRETSSRFIFSLRALVKLFPSAQGHLQPGRPYEASVAAELRSTRQ